FDPELVSAATIKQSSPLVEKEGSEVHINCKHDDSSLLMMLWYQQKRDSTAMTLIGYGYENSQNYEGQFEKEFKLTRKSVVEGALIVQKAEPSHSALYFCAASNTQEVLLFGGCTVGEGTKLTVLDETLLPVEKKKTTLVCVASDFYPDHVSVSWECSAGKCDKAATDSAAKRVDGGNYRITSRLKVLTEIWENPENTFTCLVSFYRGENDIVVEKKMIPGVPGNSTGNTRGKHAVLFL
uniref:Ig-like domain-containing protein n=1 Tax=Salarias fasciatus TaxID=181472 RepID=A0A672JJQ8_SALFA